MKTIEKHHTNGQLKERYTLNKNGKREGLYQSWHYNGQLWSEFIYKNGQLNGQYQEWSGNGQLLAKAYFKNGKRHGKHEWYRREKLYETIYYIDSRQVTQQEWEEYSTNQTLPNRYQAVVTGYVHTFFEKHNLYYEDTGDYYEYDWVADEVGGILCVSDYYIGFREIKHDIDHDIDPKMFFEYYDYCLENNANINYISYLKGARKN